MTKEKPIIMSTPMVRAILEGRKTQTRRVMMPQPADDIHPAKFPNPNAVGWMSSLKHEHGFETAHFCPYGQVGDRLWVRETWAAEKCYDHLKPRDIPIDSGIWYKTCDPLISEPMPIGKWRPSIFMPHWASRITLEVADVRVQRLQDVSEYDAQQEGITSTILPELGARAFPVIVWSWELYPTPKIYDSAKYAFHALWDSINSKRGYSWASNPWVWAITFKVEK